MSSRSTRGRADSGLTLIELLVVIVILGLLAAIAIPRFLHAREKGVDASLRVDTRTVVTHLEAFWLRAGTYPQPGATPPDIGFAAPVLTLGEESFHLSPDNTPRVFVDGPNRLCVQVVNPRASDPATGSVWMNDAGGMHPGGATCAGFGTPVL